MPVTLDLRVATDAEELAAIAAAEFAARARRIATARSTCTVSLAAHEQLQPFYTRLASHYAGVVDWLALRRDPKSTWPAALPAVETGGGAVDLAVVTLDAGGQFAGLMGATEVLVLAAGSGMRQAVATALARWESADAESTGVTWFVDQEARG